MIKIRWLLVFFLLACLAPGVTAAPGSFDPTVQTPALFYDEARAVYLGNLARRQNGVPPLRWNLQLTHAARWFSWDSTENRPVGFCDHQDTQGNWPIYRVAAYGYKGAGGAENAFCGYVSPADAINGWMSSSGHRGNLLDPNSREVGLGYYRRDSDDRGYVTQDFGHDPVYPPLVIENEAPFTSQTQVELYIYDAESSGGFAGRGPSDEMQVSNEPCFLNSTWEPYAAEKNWSLAAGAEGWRWVYVRSRDRFNRTSTVSDAIYLGSSFSPASLAPTQLSSTQTSVTLYNLDAGDLPFMQFSAGWLADDTFSTFSLLWGNGASTADPTAWGGSAYRMYPGGGEGSAWVWDSTFPIKNTPLVAYFRLKVNANTSNAEVARITVKGGGVEYGPVSLKGTDFLAANQYQEFAIPFVFNTLDDFLIFQVWQSGSADVYVDAVSIFSEPQAYTSPVTWAVPGGNYRGQGIWVRYTDGAGQFSTISDALTVSQLEVSPTGLAFLAQRGGALPAPRIVAVATPCGSSSWEASDDAPWLQLQVEGNAIRVLADPAGLGVGTYSATITVGSAAPGGLPPVLIPVRLVVVEHLYPNYVPQVGR